MVDALAHRRHPCRSCPWRTDTTGRYGYDNLADYTAGTIRTTDHAPEFGDTLFACHRTPADNAELCAGWLAVSGADHPTIRFGVAIGVLPEHVLQPGDRWPDLFATGQDMLAAHARSTEQEVIR